MRRTSFVACLLVLTSMEPAQGRQPSDPHDPVLTIADPQATSYLIGQVVLVAQLRPGALDVDRVEFWVDDRRICPDERLASVSRDDGVTTFSCPYDAGPNARARQLRVVARLADGKLVRSDTLRTSSLEVSETVSVDVVLVPVVVKDYRGDFVKDLTADSFQVLEDGVPQQITSFRAESIPIDVVLAVDISGSMAGSMPRLKSVVRRFVDTLSSIDAVTILAFNERTFLVTPRDAERGTRLAAIDRLTASGGTSLYDAILTGLDILGDDLTRKALIVFTDGDDTTSLAPVAPLEERIRESEATLYFVTQGKGPTIESVRAVVTVLATISGGRAFSTDKIDQLERALAQIMNDLSNQYLIGYSPTDSSRDGRFRRITVRTTRRSHEVRAREGYRALPP